MRGPGDGQRAAAGIERHVAGGHDAALHFQNGRAFFATVTPASVKSALSNVTVPMTPSSDARAMRASSVAEIVPSMPARVAESNQGASAASLRPSMRSLAKPSCPGGSGAPPESRAASTPRGNRRGAADPAVLPMTGEVLHLERPVIERRIEDQIANRRQRAPRDVAVGQLDRRHRAIDAARRAPLDGHRPGPVERFGDAERPSDAQDVAELALERALPARGTEPALAEPPGREEPAFADREISASIDSALPSHASRDGDVSRSGTPATSAWMPCKLMNACASAGVRSSPFTDALRLTLPVT